MKFIQYLFLIFVVVILNSAISTTEEAEGFVPLFNGVDLDNWVNVNCSPETWSVRDQMIVCSGFPKGVLRTETQYENYVLELEWRHLKEGGNAGLFVHSGALPVTGKPFTRSIECQIMDIADDIAYSTDDLEDSFKAGFIKPIDLLLSILYRLITAQASCIFLPSFRSSASFISI